MPFYDELLDATREAREAFLAIPALRLGCEGRVSREAYLAFLGQAYHHVRHTVPLLMACGSRLPARLEWLRAAVGEYIEEEMGHHEWILGDIEAAGGDARAVARAWPHPTTERMVAYAYYTVDRCNPVGFFGMVLVLEGTSVQLATRAADALQARLGLPDRAFTYLRSHGALDQGHLQTYANLMNRLEEEADREAVIHAARMFYGLYGDVFRALPVDESEAGRVSA
ncbi:MAG: iron-containing redox enzyme family protein [Gammaproteobacteria bacterium]|nr:MAG: iron-containing redox enzyme family protein [Gammaproteobacteria bacterium]